MKVKEIEQEIENIKKEIKEQNQIKSGKLAGQERYVFAY